MIVQRTSVHQTDVQRADVPMTGLGGLGDVLVKGARSSSTIRFGPISLLCAVAEASRTVIVADSITVGFVPPEFRRDKVIVVERGEAAKSLSSLEGLYARFLELGVGRDWTVVGIGGGSVSDLAGFAASTWMRGVDFGFVPTTLLAMVDASVGGKNGVDYAGYKNLIGSFSQPRFVLVDTDLVSTLPDYDLACGLAEAIKHGVIDGGEHLAFIDSAVSESGSLDRAAIGSIVRRSIELKAAVATADEREAGDRRKLNLGHTIGHGIEAVTGLAHGACVAAGLGAAFSLAVERGGSKADADRVVALLTRLRLPTGIEAARTLSPAARAMDAAVFRDAVAKAAAADKKRVGADVLFAVPMAVGDVRIEPIAFDSIKDFIRRAP